jgi:hypothetical protein
MNVIFACDKVQAVNSIFKKITNITYHQVMIDSDLLVNLKFCIFPFLICIYVVLKTANFHGQHIIKITSINIDFYYYLVNYITTHCMFYDTLSTPIHTQ